MLRRRSLGSLGLAVRLTAVAGLVAATGGMAATTVSAGLLPGLNVPLNITVPGVVHVGPSSAGVSKSPSSGAGLNLSLGGLGLALLPSPSIPIPIPTLATLPPLLPTPTPSIPAITGCTTSCPPTDSRGGGTGKTTSATPGGQGTPGALAGGVGSRTNVSSFPLAVRPSNGGSGGSDGLIPGLHDTPPLPVQTLSAVPGISFGQAPYLWPLFLLLDLVAAAAVVLVVRKTWSRSASN